MRGNHLLALAAWVLTSLPIVGCAASVHAPAAAARIRLARQSYFQRMPGVGIVVGVVDHGAAHAYTAGSLRPHEPKLDASTEFQIGSVTKTFTATLLAVMVRDEEVKLDDPIQRYLPVGVGAPEFHGRPITLRNLAEQNSGLPALPSNMHPSDVHDPLIEYTPDMLRAFLSHYKLTRAPGERYEYSSLGVGLLGDLLANRAHTPYPALLQRRVLQPLGMHSTDVVASGAILAHLAPGHDAHGSPAPVWHFGELGAAAALYSNLHDMLRYLRANLAAPNGPLGSAMAFAQRPRAQGEFNGLNRIGLVWQTNANTGVTWHNGNVGGYHAFIGFNRARQTGVVVLANVADMNLDAVALRILERLGIPARAQAPLVHEDPSITARAKALYASYLSGRIATSQMTPDFAKFFKPAFVARLRSGTRRLGAPTAWVFSAAGSEGNTTRYDYRVTFPSGARVFSVWITPDGRIGGSRLGG